MAQIIVRNLEDDVRDKLRALAAAHGHSMEEEVRSILRAAALKASLKKRVRLGTRMADRFRAHGLTDEIQELRGQPAKSADFEP